MRIRTFIIKRAGKKGTVQMLLIGLCLGLTLGIAFVPFMDQSFDCDLSFENQFTSSSSLSVIEDQNGPQQKGFPSYNRVFDNRSGIIIKLAATGGKDKLKRPRYFSTELGLRRKLLVGIVLLKESHIENLVAINQTLSPKVDKFLFFVSEGHSSTISPLLTTLGSTIVQVPGLSETNASSKGEGPHHFNTNYNLVALKVIKYFGDKFSEKFDYFAIFLDNYYINGRLLTESVSQISVSQDILWGLPSSSSESSCALESGFIISRKIAQKLSSKIERCILYPTLRLVNNLPLCLNILLNNGKYSCQKLIQDVLYSSVPVHSTPQQLTSAITVGPVSSPLDIYNVHGKISLVRSSEIQRTIIKLQQQIQIQIPSLPSKYQTTTWPLGISRGSIPKSRFDVIKWIYFDTSHMYSKTEISTVTNIDGIDREDFNHVINSTQNYLNKFPEFNNNTTGGSNNDKFYFQHGYRRLNPSRGMEYLLDFKIKNNTSKIIRIEGIRPLCKTELLPMPYVTENRRVTIIIPITIRQSVARIRKFLDRFFDFSIDQKLNTLLILALIIKKNKDNQSQLNKSRQPSLDSDSLKSEQIQEIKGLISYYGKMTKSMMVDSPKVGYILIPSFSSSNPSKRSNGFFTTIDAVIKKIVGTSALIFTSDIDMIFKDDLINRIRMNTIMKWQTFSPIPFLEYNPSVYQPVNNNKMSTMWKEQDNPNFEPLPVSSSPTLPLEVSKNSGYFDTNIFQYFSFFAADYIAAKKLANSSLLTELERLEDFSGLEQLFLKVSPVHILRAPESNLIVPFSFPSGCSSFEQCAKRNWGSRSLLGKIIFASHHKKS